MKRSLSLASWAVPPLLLIVLYSYSLRTWFQQDDFVWLLQARQASSWEDVLRAMFTPAAHGTFRPFSERGFFLAFYRLFGLEALPWRVWVFATQIGSLTLLNLLVRKLSGSAAAGFWAAIFWTAHARLSTALSWTSAYMQILCGFCLLASFYLWLRYTETGLRRYFAGTCAVFLLGFGVMETTVVFPALAASYALFFAPRYLRKALLLFVPSAIFAALHMYFAPKQAAGPYSMHFDPGMAATLWQYWRWSVDPAGRVGLVLITAAIAAFVVWSAWRRRWLPVLLLAWYLILLGPVLPLRDHVTEYYLTLPVFALAMLGGHAVVAAFRDASRRGWLWRGVAAATTAVFLLLSAPAARRNSKDRFLYGENVEKLIKGVMRARQLHPSKAIALDGVDTDLFWGAVCDNGPRAVGVDDVVLTPGSETRIGGPLDLCPPADFILPYEAATRALDAGRLVVYDVRGARLRNITATYRPAEETRSGAKGFRLNAASRAADALLGPTWFEGGASSRWMPGKASVVIPVPARPGQNLYISGSCMDALLRDGPLGLAVSIEGKPLGSAKIEAPGAFLLAFPLPSGLDHRDQFEIGLEVSRTFRPPGETRDLGLVFGTFEIR